jgi:DNA-binding transcriptional regulator LsrR (DeoR family)
MSAAEQSGGPAELVLMALISRRYFIDGASKIDIAEQTGLSRFKVARLLDKARALGLVKIDISYPGTIDVDASSRLQATLGLKHALVLDAVEDQAAGLRADLGAAAAELLSEIVTADDVLGLAWARSVSAMSAALTRLAPCTVVQMTGALPGPEVDASATELVRQAARTGGGPAYFFYAPMIVGSVAVAQALRQQPEVARARAKLPSVTKAVVGVGSWDPPYSTLYDALEPAERESLHERGVRAEVSGILIDAAGEPVPTPLSDRLVGVEAADLLRIPEVIAVAYDATKSRAVLAAVRGGLVNSLITHRSLAEAMLRDAAEAPLDRRPEQIP